MSAEASSSVPRSVDIESLKNFVHRAKEENIWLPRKPGSPRLVKIQDSRGSHLEFIPLRLKESIGSVVAGREVLNMKQIVDYCIEKKISVIGFADCIYVYNKKKENEPAKQIPDETIKEIWKIEKNRIIETAKTGALEKLEGFQLSESFLDMVEGETHDFLQIAFESGQIAATKDLISKLNIKEISHEDLQAILRAPKEMQEKLLELIKDMPRQETAEPILPQRVRVRGKKIVRDTLQAPMKPDSKKRLEAVEKLPDALLSQQDRLQRGATALGTIERILDPKNLALDEDLSAIHYFNANEYWKGILKLQENYPDDVKLKKLINSKKSQIESMLLECFKKAGQHSLKNQELLEGIKKKGIKTEKMPKDEKKILHSLRTIMSKEMAICMYRKESAAISLENIGRMMTLGPLTDKMFDEKLGDKSEAKIFKSMFHSFLKEHLPISRDLQEINEALTAAKASTDVNEIAQKFRDIVSNVDKAKKKLGMGHWATNYLLAPMNKAKAELQSRVQALVTQKDAYKNTLKELHIALEKLSKETEPEELGKLLEQYRVLQSKIYDMFPREFRAELTSPKALGITDKISFIDAKAKLIDHPSIKELIEKGREVLREKTRDLSRKGIEMPVDLQKTEILEAVNAALKDVPSVITEEAKSKVFATTVYEEAFKGSYKGTPQDIVNSIFDELISSLVEESGPYFSTLEKVGKILSFLSNSKNLEKIGLNAAEIGKVQKKVKDFRKISDALSVRPRDKKPEVLATDLMKMVGEMGVFFNQKDKTLKDIRSRVEKLPFREDIKKESAARFVKCEEMLHEVQRRVIELLPGEKKSKLEGLLASADSKAADIQNAYMEAVALLDLEEIIKFIQSDTCKQLLDEFKKLGEVVVAGWKTIPKEKQISERENFKPNVLQLLLDMTSKGIGSPITGMLQNLKAESPKEEGYRATLLQMRLSASEAAAPIREGLDFLENEEAKAKVQVKVVEERREDAVSVKPATPQKAPPSSIPATTPQIAPPSAPIVTDRYKDRETVLSLLKEQKFTYKDEGGIECQAWLAKEDIFTVIRIQNMSTGKLVEKMPFKGKRPLYQSSPTREKLLSVLARRLQGYHE